MKEKKKRTTLVGQKFGYLTVIEDSLQRTKDGNVVWLCKCDCGNFHYASTKNLKGNTVKSCGCLNKQSARLVAQKYLTIDMTGQKIGHWTVIEKVVGEEGNGAKWLCECDCEQHTRKIIFGKDLRQNKTWSCGCDNNISHGEQIIKELLDKNNIEYEREKTFDDCKFETNRLARFDFWIKQQNYLIEFDGRQHFVEENNKIFTSSLEETQKRDTLKNLWCIKNNIPLIRIPYTDINKITLEDLLLQSKYRIN